MKVDRFRFRRRFAALTALLRAQPDFVRTEWAKLYRGDGGYFAEWIEDDSDFRVADARDRPFGADQALRNYLSMLAR